MSMKNSIPNQKRYEANYYSVETTFTQKQLEEHDAEVRSIAIDEFAKELKEECKRHLVGLGFSSIEPWEINKIASRIKGGH